MRQNGIRQKHPNLNGWSPGGELTAEDQQILSSVKNSLATGIALMKWWKEAEAKGDTLKKFHLTRVKNRPETGYSFFSDAGLPGGSLKVMGDVPDMYYDRPKGHNLHNWRDQVREFALRYFMRICAFQLPEAREGIPPKEVFFERLSLCPKDQTENRGFGFRQLYYKRADGMVGKFCEQDAYAVIDVRELFDTYEWVVAKVNIFNFNVRLPTDPTRAGIQIPLSNESVNVILHRDLVHIQNNPDGISGEYSFGYATLKSTTPSFLAYGPGEFEAGFQIFEFKVQEDGTVRVRMPFCVNQPTRLINVPLNPLEWGLQTAGLFTVGRAKPWLARLEQAIRRLPFGTASFGPVFPLISLLNWLSAGVAARDYCISKEGLEKILLMKHYDLYYTMLMGTLLTWRQVEDWSNPETVPAWVTEGADVTNVEARIAESVSRG